MNLDVLKYVIDNEHEHLEELVVESNTSLGAAVGVGKILLANNGDTSVLKGNQVYVYEKCIEPLFKVACHGIYGEETCAGNGFVDDESLLMSYQEDEFLCQHCRFDSERIASE